jgi:DNA-binding CsgD family transcriptional regulator
MLKQERGNSENDDFWGRQTLRDFFTGLFYAQIGQLGAPPPWFAIDEKEAAAGACIPARELLIEVKYHIAIKKYDHALMLLCNSYPREPSERFLFGELTIALMTAAVRAKTGDDAGAVKDFERAFTLSFGGLFEMPFVERGKDLRPLIVAASKQADCAIPREWLKKIDRKASAYAKKNAVILDSFKRERNIEESVPLSDREREVLSDLYHGLSREEIAESRYLSINTVHKIIQSIFIKLDAGNNVDAIRIALEKKLLASRGD